MNAQKLTLKIKKQIETFSFLLSYISTKKYYCHLKTEDIHFMELSVSLLQ